MRRLTLFVIALFLLLLSATPASAGGPTSVLITSPTQNRAAALYYQQADYTELGAAIGTGQPVADPQAPLLHGSPGNSAINVTWLIHDVQVWRVDHVFLNEDGGPWVETYESYEGVKFDARGVVHRPANPAKLTELFNKILGAPGQNVVHPARTVVTPPAPAPAPPSGIHWTSLVIGLVGGVVLVVFGRVVVGVLRRRTRVNPAG